MALPEASRAPQDATSSPAKAVTNSRGDGVSPTSPRAWFPPSVEDFEITPEAAMYAGRR
jgi:hypothetical protein